MGGGQPGCKSRLICTWSSCGARYPAWVNPRCAGAGAGSEPAKWNAVIRWGQRWQLLRGITGETIGSAGIEGHANRELLGLTDDISRLGPTAQLFQSDQGNNVKTTIESDAQQAAYDGLAGRKGAVVVLDAEQVLYLRW